ncbi:MAG: cyclic nucleotide-binding domain-containing protein [Actinobacteria bacterium]|nr:MAG: cyclic nucleotide-binding domain-containing protein [Actinomycetota bacterium]
MSALASILRIRPGEGRMVGSVVGLLFVASAGLTIGESGVNALFFERIGPDALPVMYLAQGVTGLVAMLVLTGSLARFDRRRAYIVMPALLAAVVVVERAIVATDVHWIYRALWLTVAVATLVQSVYLWGAAGAVTDTRRAKRLFPLFGSGSILGSVVGGLLTGPLAGSIGIRNLLLVWAACLVGASVLGAGVLGVRREGRIVRGRARRRPSALRDITDALSFVRRSPLLMWMTGAGVLFSVLFYSLFLPFAQAATARYPDPEALAGFLGVFSAAVTIVAFVISILFANRLLAWLGAAAVILVLPALYGGSFGILLASSAFTTLVVTRAAVMVWLQGVASPAWETLVNVVPEVRRDQVRAFISGGPSQTGTAIAGVLTLVGQQALTATQLSIIGLAVAAVTIWAAWRIRRSYTGALVDALRAGRPSVFEGRPVQGTPVVLELDATAIGLALEASRDEDPRVRRLGVEMLAAGDDPRVRAELEDRTKDVDAMVRALAIDGLSGSEGVDGSILTRALGDEAAIVRLAAVEAIAEGSRGFRMEERLGPLQADPDPVVAAAVGVALLGGPSRPGAVESVRRLLSHERDDVRVAAVQKLRAASPDDVIALALPMLEDPSPAVRTEALRTLASAAPEPALAPVLGALEGQDASLREAALDVLVGLDLRDQAPVIERLARERSSLARHDLRLATVIPSHGAEAELLRSAVLERGRSHAIVALSAVSLVSRDGDAMRAALDNLRGTDPGQLANALETLEATEHRSLATPLLPLWERTASTTGPPDDWLELVAEDRDPLIRSCVELLRTKDQRGGIMGRSRTSMSPMERVLALRTIPLFQELSTADLRRLADLAEERSFVDGEVISSEGEVGDELHLVLGGTVAVTRGGTGSASTVARRGPGDVVGEMSIITRKPRVASLIAEGDVRTIRIGRQEFESMIRERPDVSLAMMRVLAERLGAETRAPR